MSWYDLIDKNGTAVIPDGTVEIPENVYTHCGTLKSVILPNSVRVIGRHAFDSCGSLESAVLPGGLVGRSGITPSDSAIVCTSRASLIPWYRSGMAPSIRANFRNRSHSQT